MIKLNFNVNDNGKHLIIEMDGKRLMPTKEEKKFVDFLINAIGYYIKAEEMTSSKLTNKIQKTLNSIINK